MAREWPSTEVDNAGYMTNAVCGKSNTSVAQFNLGVMFEDGRGVAQDDAEDVRLYRLAAAQGVADATAALQRLGA